jgi:hypothetical protein
MLAAMSEVGTREHTSPIEVMGPGTNSATRIFRVPYQQRFLAARAILGYSKLEYGTGGDVTGLRRLTPIPHPDLQPYGSGDGPGNMVATSIRDIKPHRSIGSVISPYDSLVKAFATRNVYAEADITVEYSNPGYSASSEMDLQEGIVGGWPLREAERFTVIQEPTPTSSYITLPGGVLKLAGVPGSPGGIALAQNVGKIFPTLQFKVLWKRLPDLLFSLSTPTYWQKRIFGDPNVPTQYPLIGTVNKNLWAGFKAGTLLLENVKPIPVTAPFVGLYEWDIEFTFNLDVKGWNWKYYPIAPNNKWYFVSNDGVVYPAGSIPDDVSIYNERDFNLLFDVRDHTGYGGF